MSGSISGRNVCCINYRAIEIGFARRFLIIGSHFLAGLGPHLDIELNRVPLGLQRFDR